MNQSVSSRYRGKTGKVERIEGEYLKTIFGDSDVLWFTKAEVTAQPEPTNGIAVGTRVQVYGKLGTVVRNCYAWNNMYSVKLDDQPAPLMYGASAVQLHDPTEDMMLREHAAAQGSKINKAGEVWPILREDRGWARKEIEAARKVDPLDIEYDGVRLFKLLEIDERQRQERHAGARQGLGMPFTPAQRAAVSAHWSAQLRAKVQASAKADAERERTRVTCDTWSDCDE